VFVLLFCSAFDFLAILFVFQPICCITFYSSRICMCLYLFHIGLLSIIDGFFQLPSWIDLSLSREGQLFQQKWCVEVFAAGLAAIVESFGYSPGNQILAATGRLTSDRTADRRLFETGGFTLAVIEHGMHRESPALDGECLSVVWLPFGVILMILDFFCVFFFVGSMMAF
jgi:hypothetical protein